MFGLGPLTIFLVIAAALLISGVKILQEYDRAVVFRLGRLVPYRGLGSAAFDQTPLAFLMACFTSGAKAAGTLSDLSPIFNKLGITSIRPASSPHRETGVSPASLSTNSMSRKILGWSSTKYAVTRGFSRPAAIVY